MEGYEKLLSIINLEPKINSIIDPKLKIPNTSEGNQINISIIMVTKVKNLSIFNGSIILGLNNNLILIHIHRISYFLV